MIDDLFIIVGTLVAVGLLGETGYQALWGKRHFCERCFTQVSHWEIWAKKHRCSVTNTFEG